MAKKLYEESSVSGIAAAIRAKGGSGTYTVGEMAQAISDLPSGGGGEWTTAGIAFNTEPNGAITLKPQNAGNAWKFAENYAFHNKPITSVVFDFNNYAGGVRGGSECFAGSTLQTVSFINYASASWKPESTFKNADKLLAFECPVPIDFAGYNQSFYQCKSMTRLSVPYGSGSMFAPCQNCNVLEYADMGTATDMWGNAFGNCYKLQTLILRRTDGVVPLANVSAFSNTPMRGYNGLSGEIYVPNALIATYQTASNWSSLYAEGHVTFKKIEGSAYEI